MINFPVNAFYNMVDQFFLGNAGQDAILHKKIFSEYDPAGYISYDPAGISGYSGIKTDSIRVIETQFSKDEMSNKEIYQLGSHKFILQCVDLVDGIGIDDVIEIDNMYYRIYSYSIKAIGDQDIVVIAYCRPTEGVNLV